MQRIVEFGEEFGGGIEVKAFSRGVVIGVGAGGEEVWVDGFEIGFARHPSSQSADGVFDSAFLPWAVGIAEVGRDSEACGDQVMQGELCAVVEGDGLTQGFGDGFQPLGDLMGDGPGGLAGLAGEEEEAGLAFVQGEGGVALLAEQRQVGLPMAGDGAIGDAKGPLGDGNPVFDMAGGRTALAAAPAAFGFGARQVEPPGIVFGPADLAIDEAVDAFMAQPWRQSNYRSLTEYSGISDIFEHAK